MEIASEHAEGQGVAAREGVEEGLLFDGVHLQARDIAAGNVQLAIFVVTDAANARSAFADKAAVTAGEASQGLFFLFFFYNQLRRGDPGILAQEFIKTDF
jgi:hypothetical protein